MKKHTKIFITCIALAGSFGLGTVQAESTNTPADGTTDSPVETTSSPMAHPGMMRATGPGHMGMPMMGKMGGMNTTQPAMYPGMMQNGNYGQAMMPMMGRMRGMNKECHQNRRQRHGMMGMMQPADTAQNAMPMMNGMRNGMMQRHQQIVTRLDQIESRLSRLEAQK